MILNVYPSRDTSEDWGLATAQSAGLVSKAKRRPLAVDLRRKWWRIQNQGNTGACVGYSVAYGLLWWHWVEELDRKFSDRPSARFVWMASKETDQWNSFPTSMVEGSGTYIKDCLGVCQKYGVIRDKRLSMRDETTTVPEEVLAAEAARNRIVSYHHLRDLDEMKHWIAFKGPVVCQLSPDEAFMTANRRRKVLKEYDGSSADHGGHAVVLAGYGPAAFILRNSWGSGWGYKGHVVVHNEYAQEAFSEAYGIVVA